MQCFKCNQPLDRGGFYVTVEGEEKVCCKKCYKSIIKNTNPKKKKLKFSKSLKRFKITSYILSAIVLANIVLTIISFVFLVNIKNYQDSQNYVKIGKEAISVGKLTISPITDDDDDDYYYDDDDATDKFTCEVENISDKDIRAVYVEVVCFDEIGDYLDSTTLYGSYIPSKQKIVIDGDAPRGTNSFRLSTVEAKYVEK